MLTTLLPGLRELRAPLAAGYLWLVTAWIALASRIPTPETASGVLKDIYRLGQAVGKPGVIAAVTFVAYIIGILTERMARLAASPITKFSFTRASREGRELPSSPSRFTSLSSLSLTWPNRTDQVLLGAITDVLVHRYWDHPEFRGAILQQLSPDNSQYIHMVIDVTLKLSSGRSPMFQDSRVYTPDTAQGANAEVDPGVKETITWVEENDQKLGLLLQLLIRTEEHLVSLRDDLRRVPARLVGKEQEIYERWDRLRAESEFRLSIGLPLLILSIVLAVRFSPLSLLLIIPTTYLLYEGVESRTAADIQLAESIRAERIASPPLARVKSGEPLWRFAQSPGLR
jgi:hypothetical protein